MGPVSVDATMLRDTIKALENLITPAPENVDIAPPPADEVVTAEAATTTDERAIVVADSVAPSEKEGSVLEKMASKGASEAGASFTQELVFALLQKSGAGEVAGSQKVEVFKNPPAKLPVEAEFQGWIAGVQVCL